MSSKTIDFASLPTIFEFSTPWGSGEDPEGIEAARDKAVEKFGPLVWVSNNSLGERRISATAEPVARIADWLNPEWASWSGYLPATVLEVEFVSSSSGSSLRWSEGVLEFQPPEWDPEYRGSYFAAYEAA